MNLAFFRTGNNLLRPLGLVLLLVLVVALMPASPGFRDQLVVFLANPDRALILLTFGILLIYAECNLPGAVLPGCLGTLLVMLALYGFSQLALSLVALAILAIGLLLLLLELRWNTRYLLAFIGTAAMAFAAVTLTEYPPVHRVVAIANIATFAAVTLWLGRIASLARRNKRISRPVPHLQPSSRSPAE